MKFTLRTGAPLLIVAILAMAIHVAPATLRTALLFDRDAIAAGEWWRLATGHWMHFSAMHLLLNIAALTFAGWWLEKLRAGTYLRFVIMAAPLLGGALWLLEPAMTTYGGLSGLACGGVTLAALVQWRAAEARSVRICCAALLVVVGMKAFGDLGVLPVSVNQFSPAGAVRVSRWAHLAGALLAAGFFLSRRSSNSLPVASAGEPAA